MLRGLPPGTSPKAAGDLCALQLEKQGGGADEPACVLTDFTVKHAEEEGGGDLGELSLSMWIRSVDTGAACAKYVSILQYTPSTLAPLSMWIRSVDTGTARGRISGAKALENLKVVVLKYYKNLIYRRGI